MTTPIANRDIVFLDTESLGVQTFAPTWEFAAMRFSHDGTATSRHQFFIDHNPRFADPDLPEKFWVDYRRRYSQKLAYSQQQAAQVINDMTAGAYVIGCNAGFDLERLGKFLRDKGITPTWHYHPIDITSVALGYLAAKGVKLATKDWKSDVVAMAATDVDATKFERHTAMGDVDWTIAQWWRMFDGAHIELWQHVFGGVPS